MPGAESAFRLDGRVALITGAARGIGAEIARVMSALGARVALADVLPDGAWEAGPGAAVRMSLDVVSTASCERAVAEAARRLGGLDILVNNAGVNARQTAEATDDDTWSRLIDTNLTGAFRMARASFPHLAKSGAGAIVNVASTGSIVAIRNNVPYCVSKAGLAHLTRVLALDWADRGVRVNAVAPTIVPTDMTAEIRADADYISAKMATIPMGCLPSTTDVANAVAFLASAAAGMITGQVLAIDGGVLTQ